MLTIIEIIPRENGGHGLQRQSGREKCWLDGWIAVPPELEEAVWECLGHCDLVIEDGLLTGITPKEIPVLPKPVEEPDMMTDIAEMTVDHEFRITLLELGVI